MGSLIRYEIVSAKNFSLVMTFCFLLQNVSEFVSIYEEKLVSDHG